MLQKRRHKCKFWKTDRGREGGREGGVIAQSQRQRKMPTLTVIGPMTSTALSVRRKELEDNIVEQRQAPDDESLQDGIGVPSQRQGGQFAILSPMVGAR